LVDVIAPLYAAYGALRRARQEARQPLDLDLPERRIELTEDGRVTSVAFKDRLDAHRLIEEFMVLANVAAAKELGRLKIPLLYRVHEEPQPEKIEALRETAEAAGFTLAKGQVLKTAQLNRLLQQAEGTEHDELINMSTLRSMTQAYYSPRISGISAWRSTHYAHFTSPIRRYSDLIVHRALIAAHGWGNDGLKPDEIERLEETAKHISDTERRSMAAERDTTDRYLAAFLSDRVGATFTGRISGIATVRRLREARRDRGGRAPADAGAGARVFPLRRRQPDADGGRHRPCHRDRRQGRGAPGRGRAGDRGPDAGTRRWPTDRLFERPWAR
jgi:ribonuclease R